MKFLSIEGKLYKSMIILWEVVKLNFMWVVFSLPIITIGASTVAAFSVTLKMVDGNEGNVVHQFVDSFKKNWKQGIILGIILMIGILGAYANFVIFNNTDGNPIMFLIFGIFIIFFGLVHLTYAFPLLARYENTIIKTMMNSREISYKYFLRTLGLWFTLALLCVAFIWNPVMLFIGLLIAPISMFLTISGFSKKSFKQIEKDMLSA